MSAPFYADGPVTLWHGDCIDVMRGLPDASVDAVVTDPPYGLEFMGKEWDSFGRETSNGYREKPRITVRDGSVSAYSGASAGGINSFQAGRPFQAWCELWATEALRVLKPGGHMLAFGGTRTFHRLASAIEDAGFEIRDSIAWLYGSGFPKSLDVSKAMDKTAGAIRETVGVYTMPADSTAPGFAASGGGGYEGGFGSGREITAPATDAAREWAGWGTALKPAFEPVVVARKPLVGTVIANVLQHGTGALNIDASRIAASDPSAYAAKNASVVGLNSNRNGTAYGEWKGERTDSTSQLGRWPANVVLDESQAAALDQQSGVQKDGVTVRRNLNTDQDKPSSVYGKFRNEGGPDSGYGSSGGASRFFYTAKAATAERPNVDGVAHPTVKPLDLMRWLVRLVTPKDGTVLEPFAGSGTTVEACIREGFNCIAIEREESYLPLILHRIRKPHTIGFDFGDWDGAA